MNPLFLTDFYKTIHHKCYVPNMTKLVSYWTPRMSRKEGVNEVVMFGLQGVIKKYFIDGFDWFFYRDKESVIKEYKDIISATMGEENADTKHIEELYDLGYLPLEIKAVKEGTVTPIKVPMLEISNTHDNFAWLVNYVETLLSSNLWFPITSATIGHEFRKIINKYYDKTVDNGNRSKACGNFDLRGMTSSESGLVNGASHLLSFSSTATIGSILYLKDYYNADIKEVGIGTPSTEHSIMCSYGKDNELECYRHLIEDVYPNGVLSIVSDTWDYWGVLTDILPRLKESILKRDGKIVVRPDSGEPCNIICGDLDEKEGSPEYKGTVELLGDIFGYTVNSKGYKVLNQKIGVVYGDGITLERCEDICKRLENKGWASNNIIFGVGSYSYQYNTRDTFGFALKSTYAVIDGAERFIFKDPITDKDNFKKSQKGLCVVYDSSDGIKYEDGCNQEKYDYYSGMNLLRTVFKNGELIKEQSLNEIRERLNKGEF